MGTQLRIQLASQSCRFLSDSEHVPSVPSFQMSNPHFHVLTEIPPSHSLDQLPTQHKKASSPQSHVTGVFSASPLPPEVRLGTLGRPFSLLLRLPSPKAPSKGCSFGGETAQSLLSWL